MIVTDTVQPQRSSPGQRLALPPVLDGELGAVVPAVEAVVPPQGDQVIASKIKIKCTINDINLLIKYLPGEEGSHVGGAVRLAPLLQADDGALRADGVHYGERAVQG